MLTGFQNRSPPRRNVDQNPPTCPKVGFSSLGRPAVGGPREGKKAITPHRFGGPAGRTAANSDIERNGGSAAGTPTRAAAPHPTGGDYMDCVRVTDPDAIPATHHHERHSTVPGNHRVTGRRTRTAADRFRDRSGMHPETGQRWPVSGCIPERSRNRSAAVRVLRPVTRWLPGTVECLS